MVACNLNLDSQAFFTYFMYWAIIALKNIINFFTFHLNESVMVIIFSQ